MCPRAGQCGGGLAMMVWNMEKPDVWAVGLMSGTSMDGVDAALIRTDGETVTRMGETYFQPYPADLRNSVRQVLGAIDRSADIVSLERQLTDLNILAVRNLLERTDTNADDIRVVGFHGQTITHDPANLFTWQLGDGDWMAEELGLPVVFDFRQSDVAAGGEGAPFAPAYHQAVMTGQELPLAVLNLGGVGNVTWIGPDTDPIAFDTGPANAMIDDWVARHSDLAYDVDGRIAAAGSVDRSALNVLLDNPYFNRPPPKSLDRNAFSSDPVSALSLEDGAATLTAFTVETVSRAPFPSAPVCLWVTGGGRKNPTMMKMLREKVPCRVEPIEEAGLDGDNLEAQAFAFLAVRHLYGMPLSFPGTTRVSEPMCGGRLAQPPTNAAVEPLG